jgi:hypothetical protein
MTVISLFRIYDKRIGILLNRSFKKNGNIRRDSRGRRQQQALTELPIPNTII